MHWSTKLLVGSVVFFGLTVWWHQGEARTYVDINLASSHDQPYWYDDDGGQHEFNESNLGVGIRYELTDTVDAGVGFYDNSFGKTSVYAGLEAHTSRARWISVGIVAGLVSGYVNTPSSNILMVLPMVQIGSPMAGVRVGHMPFGEVKFTTLQVYAGF